MRVAVLQTMPVEEIPGEEALRDIQGTAVMEQTEVDRLDQAAVGVVGVDQIIALAGQGAGVALVFLVKEVAALGDVLITMGVADQADQAVPAAWAAIMVVVAVLLITLQTMLPPLVVQAQSESSGPEILDHSHQLVQVTRNEPVY